MGSYTPPPTAIAGNANIGGYLTVQDGQSSLVSLTLAAAGTTPSPFIRTDASGNLYLTSPSGTILQNQPVFATGVPFSAINGVNVAGPVGIPAIYGAASPTHKTNAAPASTTYASPAAGFYVIKVSLDVKTATTLSATMKVTYTDSEGTAQSDVLVFCKEGSVTLLSAVVAADRYTAIAHIVTNGATNIVVADNSGTYTTCDYYYAVTIDQEA